MKTLREVQLRPLKQISSKEHRSLSKLKSSLDCCTDSYKDHYSPIKIKKSASIEVIPHKTPIKSRYKLSKNSFSAEHFEP